MPWCPNCKSEYREGISVCADCGTELTDELQNTKDDMSNELLITEQKDLAQRLTDFLIYSNIESATLNCDEENEVYTVTVDMDSLKQAKKLYQGFYLEEQEKQEMEEENEESPKPAISSSFVKKEDLYNDLKSTAYTFLFFGVIGLIYDMLNITGKINFLNGPVAYTIVGGMFIGFMIVGITTLKNARKAKSQISDENQLAAKTTDWLKENITSSLMSELQDDSLSEEINYFKKTEKIKEMLMNEFGKLDDSFVDQIVEDFYNDNF